jgi:REP element-mobilizing transposase RayT
MARKLRVQFPGALYHVINRGNYRQAVFDTQGASDAFVRTLGETCERHDWQVHAYVIMRNHFHLALETPQPNLADGMQWLQATFAARFNRYRAEAGHVFQGRYHALLVEDDAALARVVHYVHLNPVRAKIAPATEIATIRSSSLFRLVHGPRPSWLVANRLLSHLGLNDCRQDWERHTAFLVQLAGDRDEQERLEFGALSQGWAIGTASWRRALAREHAQLALDPGLAAAEIREIKAARWRDVLDREMSGRAKTEQDVASDSKGARWKIAVAALLRREVAAPYRWIASTLNMGSPLAVRVNVCRLANR